MDYGIGPHNAKMGERGREFVQRIIVRPIFGIDAEMGERGREEIIGFIPLPNYVQFFERVWEAGDFGFERGGKEDVEYGEGLGKIVQRRNAARDRKMF